LEDPKAEKWEELVAFVVETIVFAYEDGQECL